MSIEAKVGRERLGLRGGRVELEGGRWGKSGGQMKDKKSEFPKNQETPINV